MLPTRTSIFTSSAGKTYSVQSLKPNFLRNYFIVDDSHAKIVLLHVVVFSEHDILYFWDNVHLFKYYPMKVLQNWFSSFIFANQACIQVSKFSFGLDK